MTLKREFTFWSTFALAFAFISPIVAIYGLFGIAFITGGPAVWWTLVLVIAGQLLVALVFAELASRWPFEGSVYQWTRRLRGETVGWFAGWAYMWTLIIAMATVCYFAAAVVPPVLSVEPFGQTEQLLVALGFVALVTLINTIGRGAIKVLVTLSIAAEVIGSLAIATILLLFHRENGLGSLFESAGAAPGDYLWMGLLAGAAITAGFFIGFESAGAIAEEVKEPRRDVPRAIVLSLLTVAAVILYSSLALILATPSLEAVTEGRVADPVVETVIGQLGSDITRPLFLLVIVGFVASALALQASVSRVVWAYARDDVLPGSSFLRVLSRSDRLPVNAILVCGALAVVVLLATQSENVLQTLINFTNGGFYTSFAFPVLAALAAWPRRSYEPGPVNLGRFGAVIRAAAAVWVLLALVNIAWPRATDVPWYQEYAVLVMVGVLGALGSIAYLLKKREVAVAEIDLKEPATTPDV